MVKSNYYDLRHAEPHTAAHLLRGEPISGLWPQEPRHQILCCCWCCCHRVPGCVHNLSLQAEPLGSSNGRRRQCLALAQNKSGDCMYERASFEQGDDGAQTHSCTARHAQAALHIELQPNGSCKEIHCTKAGTASASSCSTTWYTVKTCVAPSVRAA